MPTLSVCSRLVRLGVYLIDTNVISEARKGYRAHPGVREFLSRAAAGDIPLYLSAVLEHWLGRVLQEYADRVLPFDAEAAQVWGRLRVPFPAHELDKQIAATALIHDLTVVTRNVSDFEGSTVALVNPFEQALDPRQ
jgi:toxin FitB